MGNNTSNADADKESSSVSPAVNNNDADSTLTKVKEAHAPSPLQVKPVNLTPESTANDTMPTPAKFGKEDAISEPEKTVKSSTTTLTKPNNNVQIQIQASNPPMPQDVDEIITSTSSTPATAIEGVGSKIAIPITGVLKPAAQAGSSDSQDLNSSSPPQPQISPPPPTNPSSSLFAENEKTIKTKKLAEASPLCSSIFSTFLFVSGEEVAKSSSTLKANGITHILNASGINLPNFHSSDPSLTYLKLDLLDSKSQEISWFFLQSIAFIDSSRSTPNGKCLIHCTQGVSRSCTLCIAYLMIREDMIYQDAYNLVKERRAVASPNTGFLCNLLELDRFLKETRLNAPLHSCRLFAVLPHGEHDKLVYVPKCAMDSESRQNISPSKRLLDSRTTFVLFSVSKVYTWAGLKTTEQALAAGLVYAEQACRAFGYGYEGEVVNEVEGSESLKFLEAVESVTEGSGDGGVVVPGYLESFGWIEEEGGGEGVEEDQTSSIAQAIIITTPDEESGASPPTTTTITDKDQLLSLDKSTRPKLFSCTSGSTAAWESLSVYDNEDLIGNELFLLISSDGGETFLWIGSEFAEKMKWDVDGDFDSVSLSVAVRDFARSVKAVGTEENVLGKVRFGEAAVVVQGEESDEFWDLFEEGY